MAAACLGSFCTNRIGREGGRPDVCLNRRRRRRPVPRGRSRCRLCPVSDFVILEAARGLVGGDGPRALRREKQRCLTAARYRRSREFEEGYQWGLSPVQESSERSAGINRTLQLRTQAARRFDSVDSHKVSYAKLPSCWPKSSSQRGGDEKLWDVLRSRR
jgi:hypothetical protein